MSDQATTYDAAFQLLVEILQQANVDLQQDSTIDGSLVLTKKREPATFELELYRDDAPEDQVQFGPSISVAIMNGEGLLLWAVQTAYDQGGWYVTSFDDSYQGQRLDLKELADVEDKKITQQEAIQLARRLVLFFQSI